MTRAVADRITYAGRVLTILRSAGEGLFVPRVVMSWSTDCPRGFAVHYDVRGGQMWVESLWVLFRELDEAPLVQGVRPVKRTGKFTTYRDLPEPVRFSGGILAGAEPVTKSIFIPPHAHASLWELSFEKGRLTAASDLSDLAQTLWAEVAGDVARPARLRDALRFDYWKRGPDPFEEKTASPDEDEEVTLAALKRKMGLPP